MAKDPVITWRDPNGNLRSEQFDGEKYALRLDSAGWVKLHSKAENELIRVFAADTVRLIEFADPKPSGLISSPTGFPVGVPGGN